MALGIDTLITICGLVASIAVAFAMVRASLTAHIARDKEVLDETKQRLSRLEDSAITERDHADRWNEITKTADLHAERLHKHDEAIMALQGQMQSLAHDFHVLETRIEGMDTKLDRILLSMSNVAERAYGSV